MESEFSGECNRCLRSRRLNKPRTDQLGQIFYGDGAEVEDGFVKAAEIKLVAHLALDLLAQTVMRHASDEVGA